MIIGIPKELAEGEHRVAATPSSVKKLIKLGYEVQVQSSAGSSASFPDSLYEDAGATDGYRPRRQEIQARLGLSK